MFIYMFMKALGMTLEEMNTSLDSENWGMIHIRIYMYIH